jgi:hypothetical protein
MEIEETEMTSRPAAQRFLAMLSSQPSKKTGGDTANPGLPTHGRLRSSGAKTFKAYRS